MRLNNFLGTKEQSPNILRHTESAPSVTVPQPMSPSAVSETDYWVAWIMGLAQGGIFHMELWRQDDMLNGERILSGNVRRARRASVSPSACVRVSGP